MLGGAQGEGRAHYKSFFLRVFTGNQALLTRAREAGADRYHCRRYHQWSREQVQVIAHTFPGVCAARHCRGARDLGPTTPGECMAHLRLLQLPAGLCHHRHSLHITFVAAISIPLPGLREQVSPNQPLLLSPLTWVENRCLRVAHMQRWGQNRS